MILWINIFITFFKLLSYTEKKELRIEENCAEINDDFDLHSELPVIMSKCHGGESQKWTHKMVSFNYSYLILNAKISC